MSAERGRLSARVGAISASPTLAVDAKAKAMRAAGEDVIGFGAGEPDFATPGYIVEAAARACADPRNHRYSPSAGLPELRAAIAAKTRRDSGYAIEPEQVLVTNGGKQAVVNTFATLCDEGDEVLVPNPVWPTFPEAIRLAGAIPVPLPSDADGGFRVTVEQLEAARNARTKALLFVSPSNPTGAVYPPSEVAAIGAWAARHGIWVVTDEIYEHLVYDGATAPSLPVVCPEAADRCVVLNGVSKTYAMTGWRVGWMIGPPDLIAAATRLQSHTTSNVANVSQQAALAAVAGDLTAVEEMAAVFARRRRLIVDGLAAIPGVRCLEPDGAFYAFPCFEGVLDRQVGSARPATTMELAAVLLEEAKVAIVPGEAFGLPGYARMSFALGDEAIAAGVGRIAALLAAAADGDRAVDRGAVA
jgi:aspartate/methionine/tyrosine aminotransferase